VPCDGSPNCLSLRLQVSWGDCDPAGIVFYPRFYAWMDSVSHALAREMGIPREAMLPPSRDLVGFPVVATQAEYLTPARMDDVLEVRTRVARVGRTSLSLRYEIVRLEGDGRETLVARGREDRVFVVHTPAGLESRQLSPAMRQVLACYAEDHGLQRS
jgi:4-hydroxybenzoyl-CoA thioesterase